MDEHMKELLELRQRVAKLEASETARLRVEEALKESLEQIEQAKQEWESTADSLFSLVCLLDHQGRIVRANRTVESWNLGLVVEVKGQGLHELFHPSCTDPACYLGAFWARAWEELARGRPAECEAEDEVLERRLHIQVRPISARKKAASFAVAVVRDVTERVRAEEARLRQKEAEARAEAAEAAKRVLEKEVAERRRVEETLRVKDREIRRLYQKLQDHADNLEEIVYRRTFELQVERDRTQAILEALGEAVVVTDAEGTIQYVNPAAVALTGFTREEALGQDWRTWQSKYPPPEFYAQAGDATRSGQTWHWRSEMVNKRKDGTLYDAMLTVAPLFDPHGIGRPIGFVSVQRDITPLKETERLKERFIFNVSHELSTPLSVITLLADNLDMLYERLEDDKRRGMIRSIQKHTQVLNDLIGDVLDVSRLDSGRVSMERERLDLAQLAREEVDRLSLLAQKRSQTLRVTGVKELAIRGNDSQLRQVIRNLLSNAIKYTPDYGQITCQCLVQTANALSETEWPGSATLPPGRRAALRVVDNGPGISQGDLPHLFERFYRVKAQGNIRGTGLGLAIARELVELHGGHITVASTLGEGSIFAIYLPLLEE